MHRPAGATAFGAPDTQGDVDDAAGNPVDADLAADASGTATGVWGDHMRDRREGAVAGGRSTGGAFTQSIVSDGAVNGHATSPAARGRRPTRPATRPRSGCAVTSRARPRWRSCGAPGPGSSARP
jgi:hypothetical protein